MKKSTKKERQARLNRKHKRAVIYIRYSSNMQRDGYSIEYQTEQSLRYIEQQGYELIKIYKDEAKTAKKTAGRDAFDEMMSEIDNDMFDVIVVFSFNRAFRNTRDALNCHFEIYENHGIVLEGVTERIDMTNPHGKASATSLFAMHELSSEITADHVKAGMYYAVQQGYYTGGRIPFGYKTYETGEHSRYAPKQRYAIDEERKHYAEDIFNLYLGGMGCKAITRYLFEKGATRADGSTLDINSVRRILSNRFYIGEAVYNFSGYETLIVKGKHPAIISEYDFNRVQEVIEKRRAKVHPKPQKGRYTYALSGMIHCGKCGRAMKGKTTYKQYKYYVCQNRLEFNQCDCDYIRVQSFEADIMNILRENVLNDNAIKHIANTILPIIEDNNANEHRERLIKKQDELKSLIKDLFRQKQKGIITEELLDEMSAEYNKELSDIKLALASIKAPSKITAKDIEEYIYSFINFDKGEGTHERYLLCYAFIDKITIHQGKAEVRIGVPHFMPKGTLAPPNETGGIITKIIDIP